MNVETFNLYLKSQPILRNEFNKNMYTNRLNKHRNYLANFELQYPGMIQQHRKNFMMLKEDMYMVFKKKLYISCDAEEK